MASRFRRSRAPIVVVGTVVVVAATVAAATLGLGGKHHAAAPTKITLKTISVTRCTLTKADTTQGHPTFGSGSPLPLQATGLITWLPKPGTVVHEGQSLIRVNDRPVVLLYGRLPHYRALHAPTVTTSTVVVSPAPSPSPSPSPGPSPAKSAPTPATPAPAAPTPVTSTVTHIGPTLHGADVGELKAALSRLGYRGVGVGDGDGDGYSKSTAAVVKDWQKHLGEPRTGVVGQGDVFYAAGPLRVVPGPGGGLGTAMSPSALQRTSRDRIITATVPDTAAWATVGARMSVDTGGGAAVTAVITSVTTASTQSSDGGQDQSLVLRVANQVALAKMGNVVTLVHVDARRANVLCVPSLALVALADGGYGLQEVSPGPGRYLPVRTGLFAQGKVEVTGAGIHAGLRVELPVGN